MSGSRMESVQLRCRGEGEDCRLVRRRCGCE